MVSATYMCLPESSSLGVRYTVLVSATGAKLTMFSLARTATTIAVAVKRKKSPEIYQPWMV
jgi:hypothetical protein